MPDEVLLDWVFNILLFMTLSIFINIFEYSNIL